jgi:quercetin dioxygenase-like cupin family protein
MAAAKRFFMGEGGALRGGNASNLLPEEHQLLLQRRRFRRVSAINPFRANEIAGLCRSVLKSPPMKISVFLAATIAAACCLYATAITARAQDPLVVNSSTIKLKFENERVRVMEATLPPGVKEQKHSHPAYVIYVLEGGRYRNYAADGKTTEGEFKTGDVIYRDPITHYAENIGDKAMHLLLVELKDARAGGASPTP